MPKQPDDQAYLARLQEYYARWRTLPAVSYTHLDVYKRQVAHGAILRVRAKNPLIADQVAINYRKADLTPRQKAMLDFALKVAKEAYTVNDADFEALRAHEFTDQDIWDIGAIAAFFAMSNRLANMMSLRPNDEFYLLGRTPKQK